MGVIYSDLCNRCGSKLKKAYKAPVYCCPAMVESDQTSLLTAMWIEIHTYALSVSSWSAEAAKLWFEEWQERLRGMWCGCKEHWKALVGKYPPDFSSALAFFTWTVDRHNDVNVRLGKPIFSFEDACVLYGWP